MQSYLTLEWLLKDIRNWDSLNNNSSIRTILFKSKITSPNQTHRSTLRSHEKSGYARLKKQEGPTDIHRLQGHLPVMEKWDETKLPIKEKTTRGKSNESETGWPCMRRQSKVEWFEMQEGSGAWATRPTMALFWVVAATKQKGYSRYPKTFTETRQKSRLILGTGGLSDETGAYLCMSLFHDMLSTNRAGQFRQCLRGRKSFHLSMCEWMCSRNSRLGWSCCPSFLSSFFPPVPILHLFTNIK